MLSNKKILICVTGGIAVYKSVALVSKLAQAGAEVKVVMTKSAMEFVTPLTFQAMSRNDVFFDTFDEKDSRVIAHIDLADWADLVIVAPATANVIGKLANGLGDDMVTTVLLATTADVWIAPAMNVHMYENKSVIRNIATLHEDGYKFIEPSEGFLACGYVGKGRLEEPEKIAQLVAEKFNRKIFPFPEKKLSLPRDLHVNESIRYDMYRIFQAARWGIRWRKQRLHSVHDTVLISGPVGLDKPAGVKVINVESAKEMFEAVIAQFEDAAIVIKSAAVADYRPNKIHPQKIKKGEGSSIIELERTTDILKTLGERKSGQLLVGFAAETEHVIEHGLGKLKSKNLDYIVINDVTNPNAGFGKETKCRDRFYRKTEQIIYTRSCRKKNLQPSY